MPEEFVIHSFRHSMRDRLRAVECPSDIIDAIGGWITTGVGQNFSHGQPLEVKARWKNKLIPLQRIHRFIASEERWCERRIISGFNWWALDDYPVFVQSRL